jgi:uncharacterized protein YutE (UPF0331/DUF86 family)
MAIDKTIIEKKLAVLADYIRQIENMDFSQMSLSENIDIQQLLSFRLQQAIETAINIATHIIAGLSLPRQETAKDAFEILEKEKIITSDLAKNMALASGLRNIVVHGYQKIDFKRLFYDYKKDLNDLRMFARQIYEFLNKKI